MAEDRSGPRRCGKHACVQHPECRATTERCACPECRQALAASTTDREAAPGDIVALHSGGPDLTVLRVYDDADRWVNGPARRVVDLGWFTATGEYRTGTLPLAVLRPRGTVETVGPTVHEVAGLRTCPGCGARTAMWACEGCGVGHPIDELDRTMRCTACRAESGLPPIAAVAERAAAKPTPPRPPRTGYRDLVTGVYHPGPSYPGFDEHADGCHACAKLRLDADDYIDRRIEKKRGRVERSVPVPAPDRPRSAVELHGAEAHPDFEYETVTFVGRKADPEIAPNTSAGGVPWVRNLHRHDGLAKFADREVTYWMRAKASLDVRIDHRIDAEALRNQTAPAGRNP